MRGPEDTAVSMRARDPPEDLDRRADSHREREHAKDRVVRSLQVFGLKAVATKAHQALEHEHHEHVAGCGAHRRADVVERRCGPREVGHVAGTAEHVELSARTALLGEETRNVSLRALSPAGCGGV